MRTDVDGGFCEKKKTNGGTGSLLVERNGSRFNVRGVPGNTILGHMRANGSFCGRTCMEDSVNADVK